MLWEYTGTDWKVPVINQMSIAPISLAKAGSVSRQPNECSIAKSMKQFHGINGLSGVSLSSVVTKSICRVTV